MKKILYAILGFLFISGSLQAQTVTSAIVPQYIQGNSGTNNNRTSFYFYVDLAGLAPGATYRYYVGMDSLNANPTSNGAGNNMLINNVTQVFRRTTNMTLSNPAGHDSLIADASGNWRGWMGVEPTGNARFLVGNTLYPKLIMNNGAGGTAVVNRLLLSAYPVKVVNYGTTSGDLLQGSFFYDSTTVAPKNFALTYDNIAASGRPVSISVIEQDGVDLSVLTSSVTAYRNLVDQFANRWGAIIPNNLANGIRAIEYRNFATTAIISSVTDADGVWCWANTVNPSNGSTAVYIRSLEGIPAPVITNFGGTLCGNDSITLTASGVGTISWFNVPVSGSALGTGVLTVPAGPQFYAQSDTNGCSSLRDTVLYTVSLPDTLYADTDNDGFGDPSDSVLACGFLAGYIDNNLDCDDTDPNAFPGNPEVLDGIDNNCNNLVDEGFEAAEMEVLQNTLPIANGGNVDFGITGVGGLNNRFFDIENTGNDTLIMTLPITFTGPFALNGTAPAFILPGQATTIEVHFMPLSNGPHTGSMSIVNNDPNENPYVINFTGTAAGTGIEMPVAGTSVKIYPTLTNDYFTLDYTSDAARKLSVSIQDLSGRMVHSESWPVSAGSNKRSVSVQHLVKGIYLVKIVNNGHSQVTRIVKN